MEGGCSIYIERDNVEVLQSDSSLQVLGKIASGAQAWKANQLKIGGCCGLIARQKSRAFFAARGTHVGLKLRKL